MIKTSKAARGYVLEGFTRCDVNPENYAPHAYTVVLSGEGDDELTAKVLFFTKTLYHLWIIWLLKNMKLKRIQYSYDNECIYAVEYKKDNNE